MTIDQVEELIRGAQFTDDVFAPHTYKQLIAIAHPDRNGGSDRVFKMVQELHELHENPVRIGEYERGVKFAEGDISDLYYGARDYPGASTMILKVARTPGVSNLMAKEMEVLRQLTEKSKTTLYLDLLPTPAETFMHGNVRVNAFEWERHLFTADKIVQRIGKVGGRHLIWMFRRLLMCLGYVHRMGWIHGAVTPKHVMFQIKNHGLHLVDWTSAEKIGRPVKVIPAEYKDWYPPECKRKEKAVPQSDIYMAAKVIESLAKEDTPVQISNFIKGCLLESPIMRPGDAWKLEEELGVLAERVYGPPKFVKLEMGE